MVRVTMFPIVEVLQDLNQLPNFVMKLQAKAQLQYGRDGFIICIGSPIRKAIAQGKMRGKKVEKHHWD